MIWWKAGAQHCVTLIHVSLSWASVSPSIMMRRQALPASSIHVVSPEKWRGELWHVSTLTGGISIIIPIFPVSELRFREGQRLAMRHKPSL